MEGGKIMTRMNKNQVLELLNNLKIDKSECWVVSSAALVIRGILPDAGDLDLAVTDVGLKQLMQNYDVHKLDNGWYYINELVECFVDTKEAWKIEVYDGYNLENLTKYYNYLVLNNRSKDETKIKIIKAYLENKNNDN